MAAIGAVIGFVLVFVSFMVICTMVGYDRRSAGVISLFASVWGGPGFGALMGAVWAAHPPEQR